MLYISHIKYIYMKYASQNVLSICPNSLQTELSAVLIEANKLYTRLPTSLIYGWMANKWGLRNKSTAVISGFKLMTISDNN